MFHQQIQQLQDPQALTQYFAQFVSDIVGGRPVVFFKFLPAYSSLLASSAAGLSLEKIRGIGANLKTEDPKRLQDLLLHPEGLTSLRELLKQAFILDSYSAFTLVAADEIIGVFVTFGSAPLQNGPLSILWHHFQVSYENLVLQKRNYDLEVRDHLTQLWNRKHFEKTLADEISRSRRTLFPVSLMCVNVDDFALYNELNGTANGNVILRNVARLLRKTSRANDIICRFGADQFCLILPHTDAQGGAVKAERLRRIVESTIFPFGEKQPKGKLTLSIGISEYPSLSLDSESLLKSADDALYSVKQAGKNRISIATVPRSFQPDFTIRNHVNVRVGQKSP